MSMKQKIFGVASAAALLVAISAAPVRDWMDAEEAEELLEPLPLNS
jgi:hypothetical protein